MGSLCRGCSLCSIFYALCQCFKVCVCCVEGAMHRMFQLVIYVLSSMRSALCRVWVMLYLLNSLFYVLVLNSRFCLLSSVFYALCRVPYVLCSRVYFLSSMFHIFLSIFYVLNFTLCLLCCMRCADGAAHVANRHEPVPRRGACAPAYAVRSTAAHS